MFYTSNAVGGKVPPPCSTVRLGRRAPPRYSHWMEPALVLGVAIVFTVVLVGFIVRSNRGTLGKLSSFLASSTPVPLVRANLASGVKASMSTSAGSGLHGLWLDLAVSSF